MRNWPIRYKLLLLAVLPVVVVALAISGYWIVVKLDDLTRALHERGRTLTEFIAPAAEYGVVSGNREHLAALTTGAREEPDLTRLVITDRDGLVLYHFEKTVPTDSGHLLARWVARALAGDANLRFRRPIMLGTVEVSGMPTAPVFDLRVVGDVTVTLSTWPTTLRQAEWVIESVLIVGSILILTILLTWWISRGLSAPLEQLAGIVARFGRGILHERAGTGVGGEIGELEHGVNLMAERLESSHLRMEHEIRQATRGLLNQVRLIDGKNKELERAWNLADEANRKKSLFLGNISHELRTPLNAIAGFIDLMEKDGRYQGDDARRLAVVRDATADLIELVNDLLDLTRIESGRIELRREPFDLQDTLRHPIELLHDGRDTAGVDIVALVDADLPGQIKGDALRIKQVLFNLLSNAGKHSRGGNIVLEVQRDRGELCLAVEDDGCGIAEDDLRRLFEPFVQLGDQPSRHGGSGLGLSITRSLVHLMGGRIDVDSRVGHGSRFMVWLPLTGAEIAVPTRSIGSGRAAHLFADTGRGRRHLLAIARHAGFDATAHADLDTYGRCMRADTTAIGLLHLTHPLQTQARGVAEATAGSALRQVVVLPLRRATPEWQDLPCARHDVSALPADIIATVGRILDPSYTREAHHAPPRDAAAGTRLDGLRFLVADDQDMNRALLVEVLKRNGAQSLCAVDGAEAVALYEAERPDVVLMDIHMPNLDGVSAARRIRAFHADARLVALTADVYRAHDDAELSLLFDAVLVKPVREQDILRLVLPPSGDVPGNDARPAADTTGLPTAATAIRDPEAALELAGGNAALARDMFGMLLRELGDATARLTDAATPPEELARLAHRLNGGARYCACPGLQETAAALERTVREGRQDDIPTARQDLLDAIGALLEYGTEDTG